MATAAVKKKKSVKSKVKTPTEIKCTKFMLWCIKHDLNQRQIKRDTTLSIGTIYAMWYEGKASDKSIKILSFTYGMDESKLKKMIEEFDNSNPSKD